MTRLPLVSVVIPAYNAEACVGRAIRSALEQDYPRREVIIVDDGSTDGTRRKVDEFGDQVRCFTQNNAGPDPARNLAVSKARGEIIAFLDADDEYLPGRLSKSVEPFNRDQDVGLAFCWSVDRQPDGTESVHGLRRTRYINHPRHLWRPMAQTTPATTCRRDLYLAVGGFNRPLAAYADVDLWIRISERSRAVEIPEPLVVVHRRPGSRSQRKDPLAVERDYFRIIHDALGRRPDLYGRHSRMILGDGWFIWAMHHYASGRYRRSWLCLAVALYYRPELKKAEFLIRSLIGNALLGMVRR